MANPIQLSLFSGPGDDTESLQGFSVPDLEIVKKSIPPLTNATKKRNKRRAWYLQAVVKKPKADGPPMAER